MASRLPTLLLCSPFLLGLALGACVAPEEQEPFFDPSSAKQDSASGSRYRVTPEVLAMGDEQHVDYTGAGAWTGSCGDDIEPGAAALRDFLQSQFSGISSIGGFACRPIVGRPSRASVHSTGRALDIMIPVGFRSEANNIDGDPIANFLIANAEDLGVQYLIWDRTSWGAHRSSGDKERYYSGAHPHNDHIHVELSVEGGLGQVAWLQEDGWLPVYPDRAQEAPQEPAPELPPSEGEPLDQLPEEPQEDPPEEAPPEDPAQVELPPEEPKPEGPCNALPAAGGVLDTDSNCLWLRGPAEYWNHENEGHEGSLAWTTAFQSGEHVNSAEWSIKLEEAGEYELELFVTPEFAEYRAARYLLRHGSSESQIIVDLSQADGWTSLGRFAFAAGEEQSLTLFDNVDGDASTDNRIVADALRLRSTSLEEEPQEEEPDATPDEDPQGPQEQPGLPENGDDTPPAGIVTSGCSAASGHGNAASALLVLLAGLLLRRRREETLG